MPDQRFRPHDRIRRSADFQRAFRLRRSAGDQRLLVFGHPNGLGHPRLGLSVSRRIGGAVVRNRWKRLLREAFRLSRENLPAGLDLVVVPRRGAEPTLDGLRQSLCQLAGRVARKMQRGGGVEQG
jgi:ribonuclease P protein component